MADKMIEMGLVFQLPVKIKKSGNWYISSCPTLDVYSQGKTEKKAKENIVEALQLFLVSCFERGTLDDVLKECGFGKILSEPQQLSSRAETVNVPIQLTGKKSRAQMIVF